MKNNEIFKTNPDLKEVHMTSDGQAFYNDGDAKAHAKTLEKKEIELVLNSKFLVDIEVDEVEELGTNDEPKLEDKTKAELVEYAKETLGLELDAKKNTHAQLLASIETAIKGESLPKMPTLNVEETQEAINQGGEPILAKSSEAKEVIDATTTAPVVNANKDQA